MAAALHATKDEGPPGANETGRELRSLKPTTRPDRSGGTFGGVAGAGFDRQPQKYHLCHPLIDQIATNA